MKKKFTVIVNGEYHSEFDNEDDAIRVADRSYTENPRITVVVLRDEDEIFSLP